MLKGVLASDLALRHASFGAQQEIDEIFKIFRTLGTPTEETWPGVHDLPDFKDSFPKWAPRKLSEVQPLPVAGVSLHPPATLSLLHVHEDPKYKCILVDLAEQPVSMTVRNMHSTVESARAWLVSAACLVGQLVQCCQRNTSPISGL